MDKKQIVVIRGFMASGKTTALYNMKSFEELRDWLFVDFESIRQMFKNNKETMVTHANASFFAVLKELMKTGKNIMTQETSEKMLMENIGKEIKKYKYQIKVVALMASKETTYQRAKKRRGKKGLKPRPRKEIYESHRNRVETLKKEKFHINTNKLSQKNVAKSILELL